MIGGTVVLDWMDGFMLTFLSFSPVVNSCDGRSERGEEAIREKRLLPGSDLFSDAEFCKSLGNFAKQKR
jgi:hypothetical protein